MRLADCNLPFVFLRENKIKLNTKQFSNARIHKLMIIISGWPHRICKLAGFCTRNLQDSSSRNG